MASTKVMNWARKPPWRIAANDRRAAGATPAAGEVASVMGFVTAQTPAGRNTRGSKRRVRLRRDLPKEMGIAALNPSYTVAIGCRP